ncbi:MAG: ATP-dependent Clp protease ATP-binding subunit [Bacteroidaceae bacterium]|nr:ATP-dependent Clp protease ATP-binding subunit [Bacteroidaceae bacterium]
MENRFSEKVTNIIHFSREEANRLRSRYISPEHLLLGMLREGDGKAIDLMKRQNIDLLELKKNLEDSLRLSSDAKMTPDEEVPFNQEANRILRICILEARLLKDELVDTEHLLLAILKDNNTNAASVLRDSELDYRTAYNALTHKQTDMQDGMGFTEDDDLEDEDDDDNSYRSKPSGQDAGAQQSTKRTSSGKQGQNATPALDNFGTDITKAAAEGKLDPVVGREKEIERVAQILSRRKKNNPILIGEPGVGKSAIVEGLATRIVEQKVSRILFNKRVVMLDMAGVVAGTKYRGQFEERLRTIMKELESNPDIILFIDEIHTIIGAGSASGSMDAANMLKPALARGEIQCIGATTVDEFKKTIEKDGALDRRFQKVMVEPTTADETLQILRNIKSKYEDHHNVQYTDAALVACVKLTDRYITDRQFPDKAIDALDEAGSRVHLTNISVPHEIEVKEKEIAKAIDMKSEAVKEQNYELAASYRDKVKDLAAELETMKADWEEKLKDNRMTVDEDQIADVVSMMSGVPVQKLAQTEGVRLAGMKDELKRHVVAQDDAIDKISKAILRSRIGLKEPNHPIGTFLFLGPTGVGKTYLAQQLAQFMFGSPDALIRIDMSEYTDQFNVSRLIGAPPGYVGYEEGGQLTEKVRRRPYSIVLLDEIEKAHPKVFNILLQLLDEGRLTDSFGRTVDFKNTVVIMTSNIGTRQLKEFGGGIGFNASQRATDKEYSRSVIQKALNKQFAPEFLNRIDEIITFDQLSEDAILKIVDIELEALEKRIENVGYKLSIDEPVKRYLSKHGYDVQFGARPLKRAIQNYLEDGLSELIVNENIPEGSTIIVSYQQDADKLVFNT